MILVGMRVSVILLSVGKIKTCVGTFDRFLPIKNPVLNVGATCCNAKIYILSRSMGQVFVVQFFFDV